jgi:alanyl-tRNA synthetase
VGSVAVLGVERQKVGARVSFVCGVRVVHAAVRSSKILKNISSKISAATDEIETAIDRRMAEEQALRKELQDSSKLIARYMGQDLYQSAELVNGRRVCSTCLPNAEIKNLKLLSGEIVGRGGAVAALLGPGAAGTTFVISASPDVNVDLRPVLKELLASLEGKGGGEPRLVQGSFKPNDGEAVRVHVVTRLKALLG